MTPHKNGKCTLCGKEKKAAAAAENKTATAAENKL